MKDLKNKKAIITGGGRGLGKATAIAFAKEGIELERIYIDATAVNKGLGTYLMNFVFDIAKSYQKKYIFLTKKIANCMGKSAIYFKFVQTPV